MKNVCDFGKRKHSWNVSNYFSDILLRKKGKSINQEHIWKTGFLVIVQLDAQILFHVFIYLFIVLYMFRACHAHHQEKQILSIQLLVIVTRCWWQCRVLVGSCGLNVHECSKQH